MDSDDEVSAFMSGVEMGCFQKDVVSPSQSSDMSSEKIYDSENEKDSSENESKKRHLFRGQ